MSLVDGLVSYWTLNESSDGSGAVTRNDSHGTNHLTDNGTTPSATGKLGNCADFTPANSEFLSVNDNSTLDFTTAFTFAGWINVDNLAIALAIAAKWDYQTQGSWAFQTDNTNSDELQFFIADSLTEAGANYGITQSADLAADTWYHVAAVYDGSGADNAAKCKIYKNASNQTLSFGGTIAASLQNSSASLKIGQFGGTLNRYWDGLIDECGLWNRALTAAEITQLYNNGTGLTYHELVPPIGMPFVY